MPALLDTLLKLSLIAFMFGSLLEMGLKLRLREAVGALRDIRFVTVSLAWCFLFSPALALIFVSIIPLQPPHALGLILLGFAPCAPFLPIIAQETSEIAYVAAFMVLAAFGTVLIMPLAVPFFATGFAATPWSIAKPLVAFNLLPLAIGIAIRGAWPGFAEKAQPLVKAMTMAAIALMLAAILGRYGAGIATMIGTYAIGTQFLYFSLCGAAAYVFSFRLRSGQKAPIALGLVTRNVGAAVAPLLAAPVPDERAVLMCVLAAFVTLIVGVLGARLLARTKDAPSLGSN